MTEGTEFFFLQQNNDDDDNGERRGEGREQKIDLLNANEREEFEWEYDVDLPALSTTDLRPTDRRRRVTETAFSEKGQEYRSRTPHLKYAQFTQVGVQYYDSEQRQYRMAMNSNPTRTDLVARGIIRVKKVHRPAYYLEQGFLATELDGFDLKTQMLHVKIPISLRGTTTFPQHGECLQLYHPKSQTTMTCRIRSLFSEPKAATGYAIVDDTVMWGKATNPEAYRLFLTQPTRKSKYRKDLRHALVRKKKPKRS